MCLVPTSCVTSLHSRNDLLSSLPHTHGTHFSVKAVFLLCLVTLIVKFIVNVLHRRKYLIFIYAMQLGNRQS